MGLVQQLTASYDALKIVDLSADFRLTDVCTYEAYYNVTHEAKDQLSSFVYGLPEKHKTIISSAQYVANPGCYATSMILLYCRWWNNFNPIHPFQLMRSPGFWCWQGVKGIVVIL